jgi:hypothetical protein
LTMSSCLIENPAVERGSAPRHCVKFKHSFGRLIRRLLERFGIDWYGYSDECTFLHLRVSYYNRSANHLLWKIRIELGRKAFHRSALANLAFVSASLSIIFETVENVFFTWFLDFRVYQQ